MNVLAQACGSRAAKRRLASLVLAIAVAAAAAGQAAPTFGEPDLELDGELTRTHHQTYVELPFEVPVGVVGFTVTFEADGEDQRTVVDLGLIGPDGFRGWSGGNKKRFTVGKRRATPSYLPSPLVAGAWRLLLGIPNIRDGVTSRYRAALWWHRTAEEVDQSLRAEQGLAESADTVSEGVGLDDEPGIVGVESPLLVDASTANLAASATHGAPSTDHASASAVGRWYRGDLHLHTGHSDGTCLVNGERRPCPLQRTLEQAIRRGLDFVAITEHNTTSHHLPLRRLQYRFPNLTVLPGREITTFYGHVNIYGTTQFVDFRVTGQSADDLARLLRSIDSTGALVSINHPRLPSGELCMGCGWSLPVPEREVLLVEVLNGGAMRQRGGQATGLFSGVPWWEQLLTAGRSVVAIGGSDNHDVDLAFDQPSAIGQPTTGVFAAANDPVALVRGLRSGRVFIDADSRCDWTLDYSLQSDGRTAVMGERLRLSKGNQHGNRVQLAAEVSVETARFEDQDAAGAPGEAMACSEHRPTLRLVANGIQWDATEQPLVDGKAVFNGRIVAAPESAWVRLELLDEQGQPLVLGNAVVVSTGQ